MSEQTYLGVAPTIEEALARAHQQMPEPEGKDWNTSKVVNWGVQVGGFTQAALYYVRVVQDRDAPFMTEPGNT